MMSVNSPFNKYMMMMMIGFCAYTSILFLFINFDGKTSLENGVTTKKNKIFYLQHTELRNKGELRRHIIELNLEQKILNENIFGPFKPEDTIIAMQVHDRIDYFTLAISALQQVRGIERTLLIFSHDVFDSEINRIVRGIKFAKVMQIFYPNSTQLFPHSFPGEDPNDCPKDMSKSEA
ncbi:alpha-1:6-mannosyl-glycoprotein 2-beta-N-acetylglucosaminyltransferase-like protein, partial [Leptotrombidium deliense]